jgi:hypothetical protein
LAASSQTNILLNSVGTSGISIGESNQANGYWTYTDGKIDDIGIWNRALTGCEIRDLYRGSPLSLTIHQFPNNAVNIGSNALFVVTSTDTASAFQWQTDTGTGFHNVSNTGQYTGATSDTLVVANVTVANNNQQFRCLVSSGSCLDTTTVTALSIVTSINNLARSASLRLFPNPVKDILTIEIKSQGRHRYEVFNIVGKEILSGTFEGNRLTLDIQGFNEGAYFLKIDGVPIEFVKH